MKQLILPTIITHSLLIRLACTISALQYPVGFALCTEMAILTVIATRLGKLNIQGQVYFGLSILAALSAVAFGV